MCLRDGFKSCFAVAGVSINIIVETGKWRCYVYCYFELSCLLLAVECMKSINSFACFSIQVTGSYIVKSYYMFSFFK